MEAPADPHRTRRPGPIDDDRWSPELLALYRDSAAALTRLAAVLLGRRGEAEEVVHDAFVATATRLADDGAEIEHLAAYVRRAVVNGSHGVLRRRQTAERHEAAQATDPPPVDAPAHLIEFRDVLLRLSWNQRAVVVLRHLEGLSVAETARIIGCRPSTVRSHSRRALRALRKELT